MQQSGYAVDCSVETGVCLHLALSVWLANHVAIHVQ